MRYLIATLIVVSVITVGVYLGLGISKVIDARSDRVDYEELEEANKALQHDNEILIDILKNIKQTGQ